MRNSDLTSPGALPNAVALKREVLRALTGVRIVATRVEGGVAAAASLASFFEQAASIARESAPAPAPAPKGRK